MALTKADIVEILYEKMDYKHKQTAHIVETLIEIIKTDLENGNDVMVSGFGKFCVKEKSQRKGRNPATGEELMLRPRRAVTFKCSGKLRERVNGS